MDDRKPFVAGKSLGMSPRKIDDLWYVHDGPVDAIDNVYVGGYEMHGPVADYPDVASLLAADVPKGAYATCLAKGAFLPNTDRDGPLLADVVNTQSGYCAPRSPRERHEAALAAGGEIHAARAHERDEPEMERDAARYRWLRDTLNDAYGDTLDEAVDKAMRGEYD